MKILADDREDGYVINELIKQGLEVEVKRLTFGDYYDDQTGVVIERKTMDDFCSSIVDGRMKHQSKSVMKNFKRYFIIISGKIKDRTVDIHENCVLGMICSLTVSGVPVIIVDDEKQLVYVMKRLFERYSALG